MTKDVEVKCVCTLCKNNYEFILPIPDVCFECFINTNKVSKKSFWKPLKHLALSVIFFSPLWLILKNYGLLEYFVAVCIYIYGMVIPHFLAWLGDKI